MPTRFPCGAKDFICIIDAWISIHIRIQPVQLTTVKAMNLSGLRTLVVALWQWLSIRWSPIVSLSSLAAAIAATIIAWAAYDISRTHNAVSTRPILLFGITNSPVERELNFEIKNVGLGPAVITNFELYLDRKPFMPFPAPALSMLSALNIGPEGFTYQDIRPPLVIPPGQSVVMLSLQKDAYNLSVAQAFRKGSERTSVIACYCAVYEDQCYFSNAGNITYEDSCAFRPQFNPLKGKIGETPKGTPWP